MIILAHTSTNNSIVMQLRSFDVPLMVLVSGILVATSYRSEDGYVMYLKKRVSRLVVPTYIFLTIFFIGLLLIFQSSFPFSLGTVVSSYLLTGGIGYVWIIKVYLLCAVVMPVMVQFKNRFGAIKYFSMLSLIYISYELCFYFGINNIIFEQIVYYLIPYAVIMGIGLGIKEMTKKQINILSGLSISIFLALALYKWLQTGEYVLTSTAKYPATLYYLSYALGVSLCLYQVVQFAKVKKFLSNSFVKFVSSSSMWIYLWHIPFVYFLKYIPIEIHWIIEYIIIFTAAIMIVYVQNKILDLLPQQVTKYTFFKYLRG